ncbi:MAG: flagellar motor switch protein FliM [Verrucomicrobia bacterium]|nr:flagellar motor switch protein FliM [Verrucomicrobiota bacterium]
MDAPSAIDNEPQPFDFRQGGILSDRQARVLRQRHEGVARALGDRLTLWLRSDFALRLARVEAVSYAGFIASLPATTHLTLFKLEPLRGVCILETPPPLAIAVVERLLGGPARRLGEMREVTEVETALFDQWAQVFLEEWQQHFTEQPTLKAQLLGHESAPCFLQSASPDTMMIEVVFEAAFADGKVPVQLAFPYPTLEPLLQQLAPAEEFVAPASVTTPSARPVAWNSALDEMKLAVSAHWTGLELTARELAALQIGDVVQLSPQVAAQVQVRLAGRVKFSGRLGTCGGQWAVELSGAAPAK